MLRNRGRAIVLGSGGTMELGSGGGAKVLSSGGTMELKSGGRTVVPGSDVELVGDFVRSLGGDIAEVAAGGGPCVYPGPGRHPDWTTPVQTLHQGSQMAQSAWE